MPVGISPTAFHRMANPIGEKGTAVAAQDAGTLMILSTYSNTSLEDVAAAAPKGVRWFQMFIYKDRNLTRNLVTRAQRAGYKALVLTVDAPVFGQRIYGVKTHFALLENLT